MDSNNNNNNNNNKNNNKKSFFQILIKSPNQQTLTHTISPNQTISHLKSSLFNTSIINNNDNDNSIFISLNGKTLPNETTFETLGVKPWSTLTTHVKTLGGGGDGGATGAESRDCYLNMYAVKKPDKVDPNEKRVSKWTTCALSHEPLKAPCVVDLIGNVFNKEAVVKALLGKSLPTAFRHVKGLKDLVNLHLYQLPNLDVDVDGDSDSSEVKFQCPITGLEFNGKYKFFALTKCGHVLSSKALKEIKSSSCLVCHTEFEDSYPDKIVINGSEEEVAAMREVVEEQQEKNKSKGSKKKKKNDEKNGKGNAPKAKRFKAIDAAPAHANKEVYASIFTSSRKSEFKETYSCRSLPLGRN